MHSDKALQILQEGNVRFVQEQTQSPRQNSDYRKQLAGNQNPFCAVLTCSDSRVPVEILFDQGIGDVFVIRLAGNVASQTAIESLDFAVHVLNISLILVMGHQNCGAVNAVIHHLADADLPRIVSLIPSAVAEKKTMKEAVITNVEGQVDTLKKHYSKQDEKKLHVCGAYYDFETGLVSFL